MSETLDLSQAVDLTAIMSKSAEEKAKQLPRPQGYRILCAIPEAEETHEGEIIVSLQEIKGQSFNHRNQ